MNKKCYIMGLPGAGKTTFLAALWHSINCMESGTKLQLDRIENGTYLAQLSSKWVDAEPLERTVQGNEQRNIRVKMKTISGTTFDIFFPDLSGETFQKHYEDRVIAVDLVNDICSADAIFIFINVDKLVQPALISEQPIPPGEASTTLTKREPKRHDPIQVQVIELLQFIMTLREYSSTNVVLLFSAWDLVKHVTPDATPSYFLEYHMNMLWQYLHSNVSTIKTNIWGVSAQGGDYNDKDSLLDHTSPINRIIVEDSTGRRSNDITLPMYSLVGEN